jgi:hypothetical protein
MMKSPAIRRSTQGLRRATPKSLPVCTGGWDSMSPLTSMPATSAIVMENWLPQATNIRTRPGCQYWVNAVPETLRTFALWNGPSSSKLFGIGDSGIRDITNPALTAGSVIFSFSPTFASSTNISTIGGHFLVLVNGVDSARLFDGTTWTTLTGSSTPAITGLPTTSLRSVELLKRRLWFTANNSSSAYYLPVAQVGGALQEFPLGTVFSRGGVLRAMGSWTIDGGSGSDDYTVFVSSMGEVAVYAGSDPGSDFRLVGLYFIGEPVGRFPLAKFGGDLLLLSRDGLYPLSKALLSASVDRKTSLTRKIDPSFSEAITLYGAQEDWKICVYPEGGVLLVNVPVTIDYSMQFCMNTTTGAWTKFTGWSSSDWIVYENRLMFLPPLAVGQAFVGTSDFGASIPCRIQQAFMYLGTTGRVKHFRLIRPALLSSDSVSISLGLDVDFYTGTNSDTSLTTPALGSQWNVGTWNTAIWAGGDLPQREWATVAVKEGFAYSIHMQVDVQTSVVTWASTDVLFELGGVL